MLPAERVVTFTVIARMQTCAPVPKTGRSQVAAQRLIQFGEFRAVQPDTGGRVAKASKRRSDRCRAAGPCGATDCGDRPDNRVGLGPGGRVGENDVDVGGGELARPRPFNRGRRPNPLGQRVWRIVTAFTARS